MCPIKVAIVVRVAYEVKELSYSAGLVILEVKFTFKNILFPKKSLFHAEKSLFYFFKTDSQGRK